MKLVIHGNPISVNNLYRGRRFLTAEGKAKKEEYGWKLRTQYKESPLVSEIELEIKVFLESKRRRDLDNILKALLDSMTGIIWQDDSQITKITIEKFLDKEEPRVVMEVVHRV